MCMSVHHVNITQRIQKRMLDALRLELQILVTVTWLALTVHLTQPRIT